MLDGSVLDVTAIKSARLAPEAAKAEAQRVAQLDPLTGVWNRRSLEPRLTGLGNQPVGVLSIEIDNLKNINDLFGHAAGDAVLVAVPALSRCRPTPRHREGPRACEVAIQLGAAERGRVGDDEAPSGAGRDPRSRRPGPSSDSADHPPAPRALRRGRLPRQIGAHPPTRSRPEPRGSRASRRPFLAGGMRSEAVAG
jgi:Diguanylate cyclase, GGDEF domain